MNVLRAIYHRIFSLTGIGLLQLVLRKHDVGKYSYGLPKVYEWREGAKLTIGAYCSFARNTKIILGGEHRIDWGTSYPFSIFWSEARSIAGHPRTKGDVFIGNDVWIGYGAVIMSGVNIGDGATIGACAVVSKKNVPPYAVVAGNPARIVKMRFGESTVKKLLAVRWWDWERRKIVRFLPYLLSDDIDRFINMIE